MKYEIGQEVRVFDVNGRRTGQPDGGWVGKIAKIGRKLVTIEYGNGYVDQFNMETRRKPDAYGHRSFKTLEDAERDQRMLRAKATLRENFVELQFGHGYTLEQIERLAAVASEIGKGQWK